MSTWTERKSGRSLGERSEAREGAAVRGGGGVRREGRRRAEGDGKGRKKASELHEAKVERGKRRAGERRDRTTAWALEELAGAPGVTAGRGMRREKTAGREMRGRREDGEKTGVGGMGEVRQGEAAQERGEQARDRAREAMQAGVGASETRSVRGGARGRWSVRGDAGGRRRQRDTEQARGGARGRRNEGGDGASGRRRKRETAQAGVEASEREQARDGGELMDGWVGAAGSWGFTIGRRGVRRSRGREAKMRLHEESSAGSAGSEPSGRSRENGSPGRMWNSSGGVRNGRNLCCEVPAVRQLARRPGRIEAT